MEGKTNPKLADSFDQHKTTLDSDGTFTEDDRGNWHKVTVPLDADLEAAAYSVLAAIDDSRAVGRIAEPQTSLAYEWLWRALKAREPVDRDRLYTTEGGDRDERLRTTD